MDCIKSELTEKINSCLDKKKLLKIFSYIEFNKLKYSINENGIFINISILDNIYIFDLLKLVNN